MKNFKEKVVVITGAGSGMGRAYAEAFAREGSFLALCDIDEKGLKETIESIKHKCLKVISKTFNISNESETYHFAQQVKDELGDCHVLINNAGIEGSTKPVWDSPDSYFRKVMGIDTNIARKESSREFSNKFLTTKSEAIAQHLIKCIRKNKIRIVYGNNAYKTWLGVRLIPLKWLRKIIWLEMKSVIETKKY